MRIKWIALSAVLMVFTAGAATAATKSRHLPPPFSAVVVAPRTADARVRITADPKLTNTISADVKVICLDARKVKVGEFTAHLVRKGNVNDPWVSVLKFPEGMARKISSVKLQPVGAQAGDHSEIKLAQGFRGCFGFCAEFMNECNWFCAFQPPPEVPNPVYFFCGYDPGVESCRGICICENGNGFEW